MRISSPFRAKRLFRLTHGKPWARLSCSFGAQTFAPCRDIKCHRRPRHPSQYKLAHPPVCLSHLHRVARHASIAILMGVIFVHEISNSSYPLRSVGEPGHPNKSSLISEMDSPVIIGSSLSTVASITARFFCWRFIIFSSTVPRAISL
jgi:hypothetical protein